MPTEKTFDDYFNEAIKGVPVEPDAVSDQKVDIEKQEETEDHEKQESNQEPENQDETLFNKIPQEENNEDNQDETPLVNQDGSTDWKSMFEKEKQKTSSWNGRIRKANERAAEAEKKLSDTLQRVEALEKQLQAKSEKPQRETLPEDKGVSSDDADLQEFFEEYPDLEKPLKKLVKLEAERIADDRVAKFAPQVDEIKATTDEQARERHFNEIRQSHPDFEKIIKDGLLDKWIAVQPSFVKKALEIVKIEGDAQSVIEMFDSFKKSTGWRTPTTPEQSNVNQRKVDALLAVEGNTGGPPKAKPDTNDFDSAWKEATTAPK